MSVGECVWLSAAVMEGSRSTLFVPPEQANSGPVGRPGVLNLHQLGPGVVVVYPGDPTRLRELNIWWTRWG